MSWVESVHREDAEIGAALRRADRNELRLIAMRAADLALRSNGLHDCIPVAEHEPAVLEARRAAAEAAYWGLQGGDDGPGPQEGTDVAFAVERALTAACAAHLEDPRQAAAGAVYEAMFALDDIAPLRRVVLQPQAP